MLGRLPTLILFLSLLLPLGGAVGTPESYTMETFASNVVNATTNQAFVTHIWKLAPDDPDQTVGAFQYLARINNTTVVWDPPFTPVTGRPGYVSNVSDDDFIPRPLGNTDPRYLVARNATSLDMGPASCSITPSLLEVGFSLPTGFNRGDGEVGCGTRINPPYGLGVHLISPANATSPLVLGVRVTLAQDDNGTATEYATYGNTTNRSYGIYAGINSEGEVIFERFRLFTQFNITAINSREFEAQITIPLVDMSPGATRTWQFVVASNDTQLRQHELGCILITNIGLIGQGGSCGNSTLIPEGAIAGVPTNPTVPFVDLDGIASALGTTSTIAGYIYSAFLIVTFAIIGYFGASYTGAGVGGGFALVIVALLGMMPLWIIVFLVLIGLTLIVRKFAMGQRGDGA